MRCFRCSGESFSSSSRRKNRNNHHGASREDASNVHLSILVNTNRETMKSARNGDEPFDGKARSFEYVELEAATQNFKEENFLGEGGFGPVYQGRLEDTGRMVAIKQLNHDGFQGKHEFLIEVYTLCNAEHPNLVELIGFCDEGNRLLLVYEYMPLGSLEDHIFDLPLGAKPLDWNTRMKILAGSARGLQYLHSNMDPPIIYRDLKCSNILLGPGYHPKLSDFGLAKIGPIGDRTHVSTRVMGTYGYCAPEYAATGQLTFKSDIYSFGVVVLEMISGRRAIDTKRAGLEQNLVEWARPLFKDRKKFKLLADPLLDGRYPMRGLFQAISIAALCLQEQAAARPLVSDIVSALDYLDSQRYDPTVHNHRANSDQSSASRRTASG